MLVYMLETPNTHVAEEAARVCQNTNDPKKALRNALKAGHYNLLEHIQCSFKIEGVSRALTHQLVRHRIASPAQESQRHVKVQVNSLEWYVAPSTATPRFHTAMQVAGASYLACIDEGMPKEDARYLLPNGTMSKMVISLNARSLDNFFKLRCCNHAQWEIRELANTMLHLVRNKLEFFQSQVYPNCSKCEDPCSNRIN